MFKKILAIIAVAAVPVVAFAQGTVNFNTQLLSTLGVGVATDARVTDVSGAYASGLNFWAQLYAAPGSDAAEGLLMPKGNPVNFRAGINAGYVSTTLPAVAAVDVVSAAGPVTVQMRAWSTGYTSYEAANGQIGAQWGKSKLLNVASKGAPDAPPLLEGLMGFQLIAVPEPSSIALILLGGAALLIRRRK